NSTHNNLIDPNSIPITIHDRKSKVIKDLYKHVASLCNTLRNLCEIKENFVKAARIKEFENLRCINFAEHKAAFISSSLGRSKRCIVLDKAMGLNAQGDPTLLTDPTDVKKAAIQHFKTIAGAPPDVIHTLSSLPSKWKEIYEPFSHVSPDIYLHLTDPVTVEEWDTVIALLPN